MPLSDYFEIHAGKLSMSAEQASDFAKTVAGDFNPLHDPDNRRFCVPGDLLFTAMLLHCGISERMQFKFAGMVGADTVLRLERSANDAYDLRDARGKPVLYVEHGGGVSHDLALIERVARSYAGFSGHNFPYILVPLLKEHDVMMNPDRPMVIYESMAFELDRVDLADIGIRLAGEHMTVTGKRGDVRLTFEFFDGDALVGKGCKRLLVSGLRPFDQEIMDRLVSEFFARRDAYVATGSVQRNVS